MTSFEPLQPGHLLAPAALRYTESRVLPGAVNGLHCIWTLSNESEATPYLVVSDGCMDLIVEHSTGTWFVNGPSASASEFLIGRGERYTGYRFLPGMLSPLLTLPASEIGEMAPAQEVLRGFSSLQDIGPIYEKRLLDFVSEGGSSGLPLAVRDGLRYLYSARTETRIERDLAGLASSRHIRRLFALHVGLSPKQLHDIIRFQRFLRLTNDLRDLCSEPYYFDLGYYDQAHFIKSFRAKFGLAPGQLVRRLREGQQKR